LTGRAFVVTVLLALAAIGCAQQSRKVVGSREPGVVERIVDGDTLWIRLDGVTEKTRLVLIDTPEVDPEIGVECFGPEASAELERLIPVGTDVEVRRAEDERDRFGRLLAFVWRADDDLAVNRELVRRGFAEVLVIEPNTAGADEFEDLERKAQQDNAGLWGECSS
jgi:micrococcal nuclease